MSGCKALELNLRCVVPVRSPPSERLCMPWLDAAGACPDAEGAGELNGCLEGACALAEEEAALWKPLVLLIPLRLGLSDINEAYIETLKVRHDSTLS